jgi:hypothetical protein
VGLEQGAIAQLRPCRFDFEDQTNRLVRAFGAALAFGLIIV